MTLRDRWAESLICRNCKTTGHAEFSQATGHEYSGGDQDISVERVPDGFRAVRCEYGSSFFCTTCDDSADQRQPDFTAAFS